MTATTLELIRNTIM
jgi:hypothetical protein